MLAIAAYAIWNAEDNLLDGEQPTAKAKEMLGDLDDALKLEPTNLGAHHLRIHLLEEEHRSAEAVPDADALRSYGYPPGTSHLPHMSGHIWARLGDYAKLVDDNERAVKNDEAWFAQGDGPGQEYMRNYHDHDCDFVLYGLTTLGRNEEARAFARHEDAIMQLKAALRMHDEARVVELAKAPGASSYFALAAYVAAARHGDEAAAQAARAKLADDKARLHSPMADAAAGAARARHRGLRRRVRACVRRRQDRRPRRSEELLAAARPAKGTVRRCSGRIGPPADAEKVFAAELRRYPNDPHLEWGLAEALKASGKDDAAPRAAYRAHWKGTPRSHARRPRVTWLAGTGLTAAFGYAFAGLATAWRTQPNVRIHAAAAVVVVAAGVWLRLPPWAWAVLALAIALVVAVELVNTAIEAVVDLASPGDHPLAKAAKDAPPRRCWSARPAPSRPARACSRRCCERGESERLPASAAAVCYNDPRSSTDPLPGGRRRPEPPR